jgi:hypothetical protein
MRNFGEKGVPMTPAAPPDLIGRLKSFGIGSSSLRNSGIAVLVFGAALLLMGQAKPKPPILEAGMITLRDKVGTVRAKVEMIDDSPVIALYDKNETSRMELSLAPDGSSRMWMYDEGGQGRVSLGKGFGDSWSLGFFSVKGKDVARLGVDFKGTAYLYFFDKDGNKVWSAMPPKD